MIVSRAKMNRPATCLSLILLMIMISVMLIPGGTRGYDPYISSPANIPLMANFTTPQILPGDQGEYGFILHNRYDSEMTKVTLSIEVYMWADEDGSRVIEDVDDRPSIKDGYGQLVEYKIARFPGQTNVSETGHPDNANWTISMTIDTDEDTLLGTYFVRHQLEFEYEGVTYRMRSRGFFSMEEWDAATTNQSQHPGGINLTYLDVDGIIPDSAFGVKKPFPQWPKYVLLGLAIVFGGLALVFYMMEEEGKFKWLQRRLFRARGKIEKTKVLMDMEPRSITSKSAGRARRDIKDARRRL